ncbi:hypothetical protein [Vibrio sp. 10N.239.312.D08]|uniref:hypothetical protein n=1 Tax=Vibrio sp. 10N.239.312.D08 TaxID=3229978 RepID=UPI00354DD2E4
MNNTESTIKCHLDTLFVKISTIDIEDHEETPYFQQIEHAFKGKSYVLPDSNKWVKRDSDDDNEILCVHVPMGQEEDFIATITAEINDSQNSWYIGDFCECCMYLCMTDTSHGEEINISLSLDVVNAQGIHLT